MKLAIMQPYIFPYIGYFQLINAVDKFVVYDNIEYTKKGWINRNRILLNGKAGYFTFPLKKDSDYLHIGQRRLSASFKEEKLKLFRKITGAYKKADQFETVFPLLHAIINSEEENLFKFIHHSLQEMCKFLDIKTEFIISSEIPIDHSLTSQDKVIAICKAMNAAAYINSAGGMDLYSKEIFKQQNIDLIFIKSNAAEYGQFKNEFVPGLSIIDVLMFNSKEKVKELLNWGYTII